RVDERDEHQDDELPHARPLLVGWRLGTKLAAFQRSLGNLLEPRILMPAQPTNVASRAARGHRHEYTDAVHVVLRRIDAAEARDLPRGARKHGAGEEEVDRRVRHAFLKKLFLDDVFAVFQDERFYGKAEVVDELRDGLRLLLERRVDLGELVAGDLALRSSGEVAADRAQRTDRVLERVAECFQAFAGLLKSHQRDERAQDLVRAFEDEVDARIANRLL